MVLLDCISAYDILSLFLKLLMASIGVDGLLIHLFMSLANVDHCYDNFWCRQDSNVSSFSPSHLLDDADTV